MRLKAMGLDPELVSSDEPSEDETFEEKKKKARIQKLRVLKDLDKTERIKQINEQN